MPVQKQCVNVGLTAGINKKRDSHQLQNGELLTANNVIYSAVDGQVTKRYGYQSIAPSGGVFPGGPFNAIGCRDNMEPVVLGTNALARYNTAQNTATTLPIGPHGRLRVSNVGASSGRSVAGAAPIGASVATDGVKYAAVVWHEASRVANVSGTPSSQNTTPADTHLIFYGLQDLVSGAWVYPPQQLNVASIAPGSSDPNIGYLLRATLQPQVRYDNGVFYIFYVGMYAADAALTPTKDYRFRYEINSLSTTAATWGRFNINNNLSPSPATNLTNPVAGKFVSYDVDMKNGRALIAFADPTTSTALINLNFYSVANASFSLALNRTSGFNNVQGQRYSVRVDGPSATPFLFYSGRTVYVFDKAYNPIYSDRADVAIPCKPVECSWNGDGFVTFGYRSITNGIAGYSFSYVPSGSTWRSSVNTSIAGPVTSYYVEYVSRTMFAPDGTPMIWLASGGTNTDTAANAMFLCRVEPFFSRGTTDGQCRIAARTNYLSTPHIGNGDYTSPCGVVRLPGTQKYVTFLTSTTEATNAPYANYGVVSRTQFDFMPKRPAQVLMMPTGGNVIAGAYPLYYDGNDVFEAGFSMPPDYNLPTSTSDFATIPGAVTITSPGSLAGGKSLTNPSGWVEYYYVTCFVRRDAYGNVIRSAPSAVLTVPLTGTNSYNVVFHAADYHSGGPVNGSASGVYVEFYRTTSNAAGTYYFIGQAPLGQTFTDSTPDTDISGNSITSNRTVYTNSGELPNDPPPACHHMTFGETRAYMIPSDQRNVIWYSKQFSPGRGVEWCANLTISEGLNSGQFTAVQVLDSNVVVFKEDAILFFYGAGPDNTGAGGGFSPFQKIASDVGCIDPGSIAVLPDGITFRSRRGIEMLTRSLQVVYIGNNVEPIVQTLPEIVSVVCMPGFTELRFVTADPNAPVLCYDYGSKRWSTFTGVSAKSAANIIGQYWWLSPDGTAVNQETVGGYLDNGQPIVSTLETAEIPVGSAGPQGWGRIYRMALLGDFYSNHKLIIDFAYDHSTTYTDSVVWDTTTGLVSGDAVYQFRLSRIPRSVMQSARIRIIDSDLVGSGQACAISNLVLEIADKNGLARLLAAKTL